MSTTLQQIPFGTPIKFGSRDGIYVEFIPHLINQHKLLINWGDHPYFTHQPIHAFKLGTEGSPPVVYGEEEVTELRAQLSTCLQYIDKELKHLREMEDPRPFGEKMVELIAAKHGIHLQ